MEDLKVVTPWRTSRSRPHGGPQGRDSVEDLKVVAPWRSPRTRHRGGPDTTKLPEATTTPRTTLRPRHRGRPRGRDVTGGPQGHEVAEDPEDAAGHQGRVTAEVHDATEITKAMEVPKVMAPWRSPRPRRLELPEAMTP